jgi:diguanylate cyclase (GGDEF)-like protein
LNGAWKFRPGDSLAWSSPALDDRGWATIAVPGEWEDEFPGLDGFGWYRRTVEIPADLRGEPIGLQFGAVGDAFEVYWDGVPIGGRGHLPPDFEEGVDRGLIYVPASALAARPDGPHVLAVRTYNDYAYGGLMGGVKLGRYDVLASRRSPGDMIIGALVSFFLAIGAYHFAFFLRRRAARENLYFALVCTLVALYGATFSPVFDAVLVPYANPYRVGLLGILAAGPAFLALVYRMFDLRFGRAEWAVAAVYGGSVVLAAVLPLGELAELNRWIDGFTVIGFVAIVVRAALAAEPHRPHARLLVVGTAAFAGTMTYDLASEYFDSVPVAHVLPGVSSIFWLGFLVFVLTVGIATAGKWASAEVTALTDPLTDLARRHVFEDALRHEAARLRRHGGSLAVVMIDLDHFKRINDTHGHRVGDQVLARVGRLLRHSARNIDLPARMGGEEFAVLLLDTGRDGALSFAERFREQLRDLQVVVPGAVVTVTASLGIAVGTELVDPEEMMEAADRVLYRAKNEGRDRLVEISLTASEPRCPESAKRRNRG